MARKKNKDKKSPSLAAPNSLYIFHVAGREKRRSGRNLIASIFLTLLEERRDKVRGN